MLRLNLLARQIRPFSSKALKLVVVGGVAGGASAAARARRLAEHAEITVLERGPSVSFANCGLPYHIGGTIKNRGALELHTPTSLAALLNIKVKTFSDVTAIDCQAKVVKVKDLKSGSLYSLPYDKLLLSPGASPIRPPLPGFDHQRVVTLRTLADMDSIKTQLACAQDVVVIGAGFIGIEMAEQMAELGKTVTIVEREPQVLPMVDADIARALSTELTANGVNLVIADSVEKIEHNAESSSVVLKSGKRVDAQLIILSVGVRPDTLMAKAAGVKLAPSGHIVVNQFQQTSDPDVYAVGDAVETADGIISGQRARVALGGPANREGRVAADHMILGDTAKPYPGSLGTAIVRAFNCVVATVGWSSAALRRAKIPFCTTVVAENQHAGYYPGAEQMTLKLLWSPESGKVLGAQGFGKEGVDKRIDVIATAIRAKMTVDDLCHLELAYAPPFNSAKDPVNILGFVASNTRDKLVNLTQDVAAFVKNSSEPVTVVDVRPPNLVKANPLTPIPGAVMKHIPMVELRNRLKEIDQNQHVVTVCARGKTSYFAARVLEQNGYKVTSAMGGVGHHPELIKGSL